MSLFPIFVKLEGRLLIVIGGGNIAEAKIPGVLSAGARVRLDSAFDHPTNCRMGAIRKNRLAAEGI